MVNGKPREEFPESQRYYKLTVPPNGYLDNEALEQIWAYRCGKSRGDKIQIAANMYLVNVTNKEKRNPQITRRLPVNGFLATDPEGNCFHTSKSANWSSDNFGPVTVPKKV